MSRLLFDYPIVSRVSQTNHMHCTHIIKTNFTIRRLIIIVNLALLQFVIIIGITNYLIWRLCH